MFPRILYKGKNGHIVGKFLGIYYFKRRMPLIAVIALSVIIIAIVSCLIMIKPIPLSWGHILFVPFVHILINLRSILDLPRIHKNQLVDLSRNTVSLDELEWLYENGTFCAKNADEYYLIWMKCSEEDAKVAKLIINKIQT